MTYAELDRRSNHLATLLQQQGVTNDDAVPLFITRGFEMLIGIVAILKTGACYVPQDVRLAPKETMSRIVKLTEAKVVLTTSTYESKLPEFANCSTFSIDTATKEPSLSFFGADRPVKPEDRCYIIFTSGTTGAPKGVQVMHGNVSNILLTSPMDLGMGVGARVSQILSVAFDMGAWEILGALSHGCTLIVRNRSIADALRYANVIISTPTVLGTINADEMRRNGNVRSVAVAGEPCPTALAHTWGNFCTFYNSCGPTEVTIVNTATVCVPGKGLTIGKPTPNNTVYILDSVTKEPVPIGDVGEMWGGGLCVSRGYLNSKTLTDDKYLPDPFVNKPGMRMYKTGDLARWNQDGELEHFGRADDQVKVKGFRVELDGVARMCERAPGVDVGVVMKIGTDLVAFVTGDTDEESVKQCVRDALPYYCVPGTVMCLRELPKTRNGKTDKRTLKAMVEDGKQEKKSVSAPKIVTVKDSAIQTALESYLLRSKDVARFFFGTLSMFRRLLVTVLSR